jgi:DNA adenine methylase
MQLTLPDVSFSSLQEKEERVLLPFRYPGGKYYALKLLEPFWLQIQHDEYREPFVGGGTVFFAKRKVEHNWLNDIDRDLISTYKIMADPAQRSTLAEKLEREIATRERWREVRQFTPKSDLEVAYKFYYLNRTSFSGKLIGGAWGYRPKRSLPPERWPERIFPCGKKLEGVRLTCQDFSKITEAKPRGKVVLMFLDPPYFLPPKTKHYSNGFAKEDHLRLQKILKDVSKDFFFFLTYDDTEEIRDLYSWANLYPVEFFYRVDDSRGHEGRRRMGTELVIANYKVKMR